MKYYIVDAFAEELFTGNQAGVCMMDTPLDDRTMQNIAAENNLAETAFLIRDGDKYNLRWFTPEQEFDLCGHATLASAFVLFNFYERNTDVLQFNTQSGMLTVERRQSLYVMDFPARMPEPVEVIPLMEQAVGVPVSEAYLSRDMVLLLPDEDAVRRVTPDLQLAAEIPGCENLIVTARGTSADFVSRFFTPGISIPEDPVTGSAHATLIPFWALRLKKNKMTAQQLSRRGGTLFCENCGDRVKIAGKAVLYLQGEIVTTT